MILILQLYLHQKEIKKKFENTEVRVIDTGIEHGSLLTLNNK